LNSGFKRFKKWTKHGTGCENPNQQKIDFKRYRFSTKTAWNSGFKRFKKWTKHGTGCENPNQQKSDFMRLSFFGENCIKFWFHDGQKMNEAEESRKWNSEFLENWFQG
jgi:hypothetical protein